MTHKDILANIGTINTCDDAYTLHAALVMALDEWLSVIRGALMSGRISQIVDEIGYMYKSAANYHIIKFTGYDYGTDYIVYDEVERTISTKMRFPQDLLGDTVYATVSIPDDIYEMMQTTIYYIEAWQKWRAEQRNHTE